MAITNKDIEKLKEVFVTKEEFNQRFEQIEIKFEGRFNEVNNKFNEVTNLIDHVMFELRDMRQEVRINFSQYRRHDDMLENHEKRIKFLETARN
jgi:type I site-specific restriction endonuclease